MTGVRKKQLKEVKKLKWSIKIPDVEKEYHKLLCVGIVGAVLLKLLLMGLFSSDYQDLMFIPFVTCFLGGENPYQYYYENVLLSSFPYPPVMLYVECIGGLLLRMGAWMPVFVQNLLFKVPLLLMDLLGLYFLMRISTSKRKYILILYFLSPIMLYATYMHGQLDIVPTAFLVGAVYYLTQVGNSKQEIARNEWKFVLFLTLSLASKFHIVVVLPLFFLYLYKKKGFKKAALMSGLPILFTTLIVLPFWGSGFADMVLFNKEQNAIEAVYIDYGSRHLLLCVLVLLIIYFQAFYINQMNRDLLISMTGLLFAVFLVFVPAMPGWFIWIVPFFMLYLAGTPVNRGKMVVAYGVFNVLYLLYYVCLHVTEFTDLSILGRDRNDLKYTGAGVGDIVFTLMAGVFLILIVSMYISGVNSNSYYRRRNRPFTIGIAGDSGAGKSRLLLMLDELLCENNILNIEGDGDHRWERGDANWNEMTHLNPRANYLYRQAEDLRALRCNNSVKRSEYDHNTGTFSGRKKLRPKPYVVMCGLHSLYLPQMRQVLDLKIYLDTDEELRYCWKLHRDLKSRGHSAEEILEQMESRRKDAERYIHPQKQYADLVIRYYDVALQQKKGRQEPDLGGGQVKLGVEFLMDVSINIEPMLEYMRGMGIHGNQVYDKDLLHQRVSFDSSELDLEKEAWGKIAGAAIPQMEDLVGAHIVWECGVNGMVQVMLLLIISEIMKRK